MNKESIRLQETQQNIPWKKWGPYLSERQWGTVREDYSEDGDAWNFFSHDQARSRAYRWGEDGLAGLSDDTQTMCFCLALWNGKDPIIKERLYGLTNSEGNHGEDVKEYYFYLDSTPTHSYMKYLYKYPHKAYPYVDLIEQNKKRGRNQTEYELLDTGIFNEDRYFDIFVEYAKETPDEILIKITAFNRGPDSAPLHILPTLWFRNTWSGKDASQKPLIKKITSNETITGASASSANLGEIFFYCQGDPHLLFTENETNNQLIYNTPNNSPYVKDGINNFLINGDSTKINPNMTGTKVSPHYPLTIPSAKSASIYLKISLKSPENSNDPFGQSFHDTFALRVKEADEFYKSVIPSNLNEDQTSVVRQAMAGMLWGKQYYSLNVDQWLNERNADPFKPFSRSSRNKEWFHMINNNVISMPDKWEYPWYAAWDLAFHTIALSLVDIEFAKDQLKLMLKEFYLHPNGQIPAYEWNFSDVNPPVHAWAAIFLAREEQKATGKIDYDFLKRCFTKLMLNFNWWINRKDRFGKNIFEGGFLGLDNIGVFDRSSPLPTGGYLEQADGTAWIALFCQNMLEISLELVEEDPTYEDMAIKFGEHFLWIATAINKVGSEGMWDEEDGFYYDILRTPDGKTTRLKVRSIVGLLPLCAATVFEEWQRKRIPNAMQQFHQRLEQRPEIMQSIHLTGKDHLGYKERGIIALVNQDRLRKILTKMLDEEEFLSPYGIRALSKYHKNNPYIFYVGNTEYKVSYLPGESDTGMFGGNSNWRGPIWMPINILIIRALLNYYLYYGDSFKIEFPTRSGIMMNLFEVCQQLTNRLSSIFLKDSNLRRPVYNDIEKFQTDPYWKDLILFYEYFHGDTGRGIGASHQTGWTGIIGKLMVLLAKIDPKTLLERGRQIKLD